MLRHAEALSWEVVSDRNQSVALDIVSNVVQYFDRRWAEEGSKD